MGTRERRDRQRGELRSLIMDTARTLFASEGYEAVSMRRIADAIEYSPTAIYVYFKDKDALIRELCRADFEKLSAISPKFAAIADPIERIGLLRLATSSSAAPLVPSSLLVRRCRSRRPGVGRPGASSRPTFSV